MPSRFSTKNPFAALVIEETTPAVTLFHLPLELRQKIYEATFEDGISCGCDEHDDDPDLAPREKAPRPFFRLHQRGENGDPLALLRTCQQLRWEATPYAYHTVTLCENLQHIRDLNRLANSNALAVSSIRRLTISVDDEYEDLPCEGLCGEALDLDFDYIQWMSAPLDQIYDGLYRGRLWGHVLKRLVWDRLCLESFTVHLVETNECAQPAHRHVSLLSALSRMESCRLFTLIGDFHLKSLIIFAKEYHIELQGHVETSFQPQYVTMVNHNYKKKWDQLQEDYRKMQSGEWEETGYYVNSFFKEVDSNPDGHITNTLRSTSEESLDCSSGRGLRHGRLRKITDHGTS